MLLNVSILGFVLAGIILLFSSYQKSKNAYLAAYLMGSNLFSLIYYVIFESQNVELAALFAINFTPIYFLNQPFLHLYIISQQKDFTFKPKYFLFFAPFALIVLNIFPYLFTPFTEKVQFAKGFLDNAELLYQSKMLYLPYYYQSLLRPTFNLILLGFTYYTYYKTRNTFVFPKSKFNVRNFVFTILLISGLLNSLSFVFIINKLFIQTMGTALLTNVSFATINSMVSYLYVGQNLLLLFFPQILFQEQFLKEETDQPKKASIPKTEPSISNDRFLEIEELIQSYMLEKPYLSQGFTLTNISQQTGLPAHQLSMYFNEYMKSTFNDWKNKLRIEYVVSEIQEGKLEFLTIEGIATSSGFASRSNFNKAFFATMNQTPSEYIKSLKK
jgi:AraC-like DNA-binding protein